MTVIAAQPVTLSIPTPGAVYTITGPDGFNDGGTTDASGNASPSTPYPPGMYSVAWSYQPPNGAVITRTDSMNVAIGTAVYPFSPLPIVDQSSGDTAGTTAATTASGVNPSGLQPVSLGQSPSSNLSTTASSPSAQAVTWPPYNYGRYFTPTQAYMYIGNVFIDELNGFQYTLQGNKVPVFGYSSYKMDAIGTGKSLVQGQLTINFISEGYLYTVLHDFRTKTKTPRPDDEQAALNLVNQYSLLSSNGASQAQLVTVKQQLTQLLARNANLPSVIANAQKSSQPEAINPVYSKTPFDIMFQFEGGGRTITKKIRGCVLTSNEQILGDGDSVVLEAYGFIARDIS